MPTKKAEHCTVAEWNLRTFAARYDGCNCAKCRKEIALGEAIALLPTDKRTELFDLGYLKSKTRKYVHLTCLPVLLPADMIPALVEATNVLAARTDPKWPKDGVGFSMADHSPCTQWVAAGAPRIYAGEAARRLRSYIETQLGGVESDLGAAVLRASNYRPVRVTGTSKQRGAAKLDTTNSAPAVVEVQTTLGGKDVAEAKRSGAVQIKANGEGLKIILDPPWERPEHGAVKDELKRRGAARWDPAAKCWRMSAAAVGANWDVFETVETTVTPGAAKRLAAVLERKALSSALDIEGSEIGASVRERLADKFPEGLALRPFQEAAVAFIEAANGKALVADEMGTGKSIETVGYLALHPEHRPALLIVPAVVAPNWERELNKWLPAAKTFRVKKTKDEIPADTEILVVTYDMARRRVDELAKGKFRAVVIDESHFCKNNKSQRSKAILTICAAARPKTIIALSGTPLINRPIEFYTTLKLLRPDDFSNWKHFTKQYCAGHYERIYAKGGAKQVWKCDGASNLRELNQRLKDVMIRRLKKDVLTELPPITVADTPVELLPKEKAAYNRAVKAAYASMDPKDPGAHLVAITAARKAVGIAKIRAATEWVLELHEQGQPSLVFAHHEDVRKPLEAALRDAEVRCAAIDGKTPQEKRQERVDAFQAGELDCLVLSTEAAGVGITLTRASNVIHLERSWTPGSEQQSWSRAHRLGQTDPVTVRVLHADVEIDDDMAELLRNKALVIAEAVDGEGAAPTTTNIRKELVERWTARRKK